MGITNNLETIKQDFAVFGLKEGTWEVFQKGVMHDAFLVRKKL